MIAGSSLPARAAIVALLISVSACGTAPERSAAVPAKRYPWDRRTADCFEGAALRQIPKHCQAPEWSDFAEAKEHFESLFFVEPDYELVERAANELGFSKARFPSGEYHFEALYQSMVERFQFAGVRGEARAKAWSETNGGKGYAQLAQALVYYGYATSVRTKRAARTVSPEAWELYYANLERASSVLDAASPELMRTGPWHALKVSIAFEHPKYARERLKLLQAAVAAWPDYLALYVIPMEKLHPEHGGSFELMEGVAQFTLSLTRATHGAAMYALAYENIFRTVRVYTIKDSNVDWLTLRQGIGDIERRRDIRSPLLWKNFAQLACNMRDQATARHLYALYDDLVSGALPDPSDPCRAFALASSSAF